MNFFLFAVFSVWYSAEAQHSKKVSLSVIKPCKLTALVSAHLSYHIAIFKTDETQHKRPWFHKSISAWCHETAIHFLINNQRPSACKWVNKSNLAHFNKLLREQSLLDLTKSAPSSHITKRCCYIWFSFNREYLIYSP